MDKLTPKQQRFVEEYIVDLNGTQAAIRAGYSQKTAKEIAAENLTKPDIQNEIEKAEAARAERTKVTADRTLLELARIGYADMRQFAAWGPDGVSLTDSKDLSPDDAACVLEVSDEPTKLGTKHKIKLHDKVRALELIARHLGMLKDNVNLVTDGLIINIGKRDDPDALEN